MTMTIKASVFLMQFKHFSNLLQFFYRRKFSSGRDLGIGFVADDVDVGIVQCRREGGEASGDVVVVVHRLPRQETEVALASKTFRQIFTC